MHDLPSTKHSRLYSYLQICKNLPILFLLWPTLIPFIFGVFLGSQYKIILVILSVSFYVAFVYEIQQKPRNNALIIKTQFLSCTLLYDQPHLSCVPSLSHCKRWPPLLADKQEGSNKLAHGETQHSNRYT